MAKWSPLLPYLTKILLQKSVSLNWLGYGLTSILFIGITSKWTQWIKMEYFDCILEIKLYSNVAKGLLTPKKYNFPPYRNIPKIIFCPCRSDSCRSYFHAPFHRKLFLNNICLESFQRLQNNGHWSTQESSSKWVFTESISHNLIHDPFQGS